jgi:DNA-binding MarR family transcriptional regulator
VSAEDRREVRLHLSNRGRAFLADLRARREGELQTVLRDMPAAKRVALLEGLEAFCAAAATQIHDDVADSGSRTA